MKKLLFMLVCLLVLGCSKDKTQLDKPPLLWETPLQEGQYAFSFSPIVHNNLVIYSAEDTRLVPERKAIIRAIDQSNGAKVWEWNDIVNVEERFRNSVYQFEDMMICATNKMVYAIDKNTGKTLWKTQAIGNGASSIVGVGETIYWVNRNSSRTQVKLLKGNVRTGNWQIIYQEEDNNAIVDFDCLIGTDETQKQYLYVTFAKLFPTNTLENRWLKIDIQTNDFLFNKVAINNKTLDDVQKGFVYVIEPSSIAVYKENEKEIYWRFELPQVNNLQYPAGTGGFSIKNGQLTTVVSYNTSQYNNRIVCYDVNNTNLLWQMNVESGVTGYTDYGSKLFFTSSSGYLNIWDINNMQNGISFPTPQQDKKEEWFSNKFIIHKENKRLFIISSRHLFCYDISKL